MRKERRGGKGKGRERRKKNRKKIASYLLKVGCKLEGVIC
jgi:hypothetical protein